MKVPISWLSDYVDIDMPIEMLSHKLTMSGLEIGSIDTIGGDWGDLIVVGRILEINPHPNADRLKVPLIDVGQEEPVSVVCGAPNIRVGQNIAYASEGAKLTNPKTGQLEQLRKAEIRGISSLGMVCSSMELGISDDHQGILELDQELLPGTPLTDILGDQILETELTPNRPDCLSVVGTAYEVAALTDQDVTYPDTSYFVGDSADEIGSVMEVFVEEPNLCLRYTGTVVRNVQVGPSPSWLTNRLERAGIRPINNVVDITNYVMMELGQPLHAFDRAKVTGNTIYVRSAKDKEILKTLDGQVRNLTKETLVIADVSGPIGLAGIMGGANTEVDDATNDVFLEAANFSASSIRQSRSLLNLNTEASYRFERVLQPELALRALKRATKLLVEICNGSVTRGHIDVYPGKTEPQNITVSLNKLGRMLGAEFSYSQVLSVLLKLGFAELRQPSSVNDLIDTLDPSAAANRDYSLTVTPPYWRSDINIEEDVVEEFARIFGYDNLPSKRLTSEVPEFTPNQYLELKEIVRDNLVGTGMSEMVSYVVTSRENLRTVGAWPDSERAMKLLNPMDQTKPWLRSSLLGNLCEGLARNHRVAPSGVRMFEIGHVFTWAMNQSHNDLPNETEHLVGGITGLRSNVSIWQQAEEVVDFFDLKGILEHALPVKLNFSPADHPALKPGVCASISVNGAEVGYIGQINENVAGFFELPKDRTFIFEVDLEALANTYDNTPKLFESVARFPSSARDIALLADKQRSSAEIESIIGAHKLVEDVLPIDSYIGDGIPEGTKSLTYRIIFQSETGTLESGDVDKAQRQIMRSLKHQLNVDERFHVD